MLPVQWDTKLHTHAPADSAMKIKSHCTEVNNYAKEHKHSINDSFDPQTSWEQMHLECGIHEFT